VANGTPGCAGATTSRKPRRGAREGVGHGNLEVEAAGNTAAVVERNLQRRAREPELVRARVYVSEPRRLRGSAAALAGDEQGSRARDGGDHRRD
jgi:hypothetical protein